MNKEPHPYSVPIKPEEHLGLAQAWIARKGAFARLGTGYPGPEHWYVKEYAYDDMLAAAYLGLCEAAKRFDPERERGSRFSTMAVMWMCQAAQRWGGHRIFFPNRTIGQARPWGPVGLGMTPGPRTEVPFTEMLGSRATYDDDRDGLEEHLGLYAPGAGQRLAGPLDDERSELGYRQAMREDAAWFLRKLRSLPRGRRMAYVVRERLMHGRTLAAVATDLGVTRERVRQIQVTAMEKMEQWQDWRARINRHRAYAEPESRIPRNGTPVESVAPVDDSNGEVRHEKPERPRQLACPGPGRAVLRVPRAALLGVQSGEE